jgi:hypothetical protein
VPSHVSRTVALRHAFYAALGLALVAAPGPTVASQTQADSKTGSLRIVVVDPAGAAIAKAEIQIQLRPRGPTQNFSADESGKLLLDLQPGGYDVFISCPGFRHETKEIKVDQGSHQELPVRLEVASFSGLTVGDRVYAEQVAAVIGTVEIGVKDASGGWIDGVRVKIRVLPDGPVLNPTVVPDGKFKVSLGRGAYELTFSEPGFEDATKRIDVGGGDTQSLDVVMEVQLCTSNTCVGGGVMILEPEIAPLPGLAGGCMGREQIAEIQPTDPVYADGVEVAKSLDDLGIMVRCTCSSKMAPLFPEEVGAAWFRSDEGIFEVVFLPKGRTFAHLKVVAQRDGDRYLTSFEGRPHSAIHMDGSKPTYFIKRGNKLYSVWGDEKLAALLELKIPK